MDARSTRLTYTVARCTCTGRSPVLERGRFARERVEWGVATGIFSTRAIAVPKTRPQRVRFVHPVGDEQLCSLSDDLSDLLMVPLSLLERKDSTRLVYSPHEPICQKCTNLTGRTFNCDKQADELKSACNNTFDRCKIKRQKIQNLTLV